MTVRAPAVTIELKDATDEPELAGLSHIISILHGFDAVTQERMLNYLCDRFPKVRIGDGETKDRKERP